MLTRFRGFSSLKPWGLKIAKKRGHQRACVTVARKLAVIMHAMWRDGTEFRFKAPQELAEGAVKGCPKVVVWQRNASDPRAECAAKTDGSSRNPRERRRF